MKSGWFESATPDGSVAVVGDLPNPFKEPVEMKIWQSIREEWGLLIFLTLKIDADWRCGTGSLRSIDSSYPQRPKILQRAAIEKNSTISSTRAVGFSFTETRDSATAGIAIAEEMTGNSK